MQLSDALRLREQWGDKPCDHPDISKEYDRGASDDAPTLLIHGDKDTLVPIEHSRNIVPLLEKAGVAVKLVTVEGAGHGFTQKQNQEVMAPALMAWFEKHLSAK